MKSDQTRQGFNRRRFLARAGTACAAPLVIPASVLGAGVAVPPNERLGVALVGKGVMGSGHLKRMLHFDEVRLLALCEVDRTRRESGVKQANAFYRARGAKQEVCRGYNDVEEVLARDDIDAVLVATPDHWHTPIAILAARAGKDIYCEKPASLTLGEGRQLVTEVRENQRVFQTGTQYRTIPTIHKVVQFVRQGGLGRVKAAFTLWRKLKIPTVGASWVPLDPDLKDEPVLEGLDWDRWVGSATLRPYSHHYHRNPAPGVVPWTFCKAFGGGAITNYHSHAADVLQYALGQETSGPVEVLHPDQGAFPTLTCRYADGTLLHHLENWQQAKSLYHAVPEEARLEGLFGGLIVGERGWITCNSNAGPVEGGPADIFEDLKLVTHEVNTGSNNIHQNWLNCIRSREKPSAHEEIGHRAASLGHLVDTGYRLGRSLKWDPVNEVYAGDDEANALRTRERRAPYTL